MRNVLLALALAAGALGLSSTASQAHYYGGGYYGHSHYKPYYKTYYGGYCFRRLVRVWDPYYGWTWRKRVICR